MTEVVVDASLTLAWCFDDEANEHTDAILDRAAADGIVVPALWSLEVANGLLISERRGRITPDQTAGLLSRLNHLHIQYDDTSIVPRTTILGLARTHRLTAYDAAYLELAVRRALPVATLDKELQAACEKAGVALVA